MLRKSLITSALGVIVLAIAGCTAQTPSSQPSTNSSTSPTVTDTTTPTSTGGNSSSTLPADWPSDSIPAESGAFNYSYAKVNNSYYLSYEVASQGKTYKQVATDVEALLIPKGWVLNTDSQIETDTAVQHYLNNGGNSMILNIGTGSDSNSSKVTIIAGPQGTPTPS